MIDLPRAFISRALTTLLAIGLFPVYAASVSAQSTSKPTLAEADRACIDSALGDKLAQSINQNVYISAKASVSTMETNRFVRNTNLWIGPVDLTAVAAYNTKDDGYGTKFEITAISPIHCLGAAHVTLKPGTKLNFVGADNRTYTRRVVASQNPVDDVAVYLLDSELPAAVRPMAVLPASWAKYLPVGGEPLQLPVIYINQDNKLFCGEAYSIAPGPNPQVMYNVPSTPQRRAFNVLLRSGDSSYPEMLVLNGQAVILSTFHFGGYGAGPFEAAYFDKINAAMHKLSDGADLRTNYQLRPANLKGLAKL